MKLMTLNLWGGRRFGDLIDYISGSDADIFCFQEVFDTFSKETVMQSGGRADLFKQLRRALPDHQGFFCPSVYFEDYHTKVDFDLRFGLAAFVRDGSGFRSWGKVMIYPGGSGNHARDMQYVSLSTENNGYTFCHFHGLWVPGSKTDNPDRLRQSKLARDHFNGLDGRKILCGDFNLDDNTKSLAMLEDGLRNLVREFGITSTRSKLYGKPHNHPDYILVEQSIRVKRCYVDDVMVSDHLPLIVEFD